MVWPGPVETLVPPCRRCESGAAASWSWVSTASGTVLEVAGPVTSAAWCVRRCSVWLAVQYRRNFSATSVNSTSVTAVASISTTRRFTRVGATRSSCGFPCCLVVSSAEAISGMPLTLNGACWDSSLSGTVASGVRFAGRTRVIPCRLAFSVPKGSDIAKAAETLAALLAQPEDWKHLGVKTKGRTLLVVAREHGRESEVARLEHVGDGEFGLAILWHNGKWQRVPVPVRGNPRRVSTPSRDGSRPAKPAGSPREVIWQRWSGRCARSSAPCFARGDRGGAELEPAPGRVRGQGRESRQSMARVRSSSPRSSVSGPPCNSPRISRRSRPA